ncbi:MAG: hypothetical protein OXE41_05410 [Gammaproteobacteria bacterium]|nr:hypothetical protein [Gammaproteobacteria bacterium]
MKQKIYIAALLAGMLALAGCGGGNSSTNTLTPEQMAAQKATETAETKIGAANTAVAALTPTSNQAAVDAAEDLIEDAEEAIDEVPEAEQAALDAMLADSKREIDIQKARLAEAEKNSNLAGTDNRTQAEIDTANKALCEAGGGKYENGACTPDTSAADRAQYLALYSALNKSDLADFVGSPATTPATAKTQDAYKQETVSMQGAKFSTLTTVTLGTGVARDTNFAATGTVTLAAGAAINKDHVVFDGVATVGTETHDKETVVNGAAVFQVSGSFRGVDGTYTCSGGSDCTSAIAGTNTLSLAGTWTFVPTNKDSRITDNDAVKYGWWTNTPTGGSLTVGLFSDRGRVASNYSGYTGGGTATYKGKALGQYVIDEDDHGAFTATATLTATFGVNDSIEGMIDSFKGDDGQDRTDWKVVLHKSEFGANLGTFQNDANSRTENGVDRAPDTGEARFHIGDAKGSVGNWQAALYGSPTNTSAAPTHAAGEFFAHGQTTERIIGAFGAKAE